MKNILLALLLANILYFVFGGWSVQRGHSGQGWRLLPRRTWAHRLDVTAGRDSDAQSPASGLCSGPESQSALEAVVGRTCVTIWTVSRQRGRRLGRARVCGSGHEDDDARRHAPRFLSATGSGFEISTMMLPRARFLLKLQGGGARRRLHRPLRSRRAEDLAGTLFGDIAGAEKIELQARSLEPPGRGHTEHQRAGCVSSSTLACRRAKGRAPSWSNSARSVVLLRERGDLPTIVSKTLVRLFREIIKFPNDL